MTEKRKTVNLPAAGTTAPLQNVALCDRLMEHLISRPDFLPGIGALYGPSGYGKSVAAAYVANKRRAYYIECKSAWSRSDLLRAILKSIGLAAHGTLASMVEQISEQLALSGRPLLIDEMDHIVKASTVEIVRDIYEGSNAPILLIGEEQLPTKLKRWERFHNRVLRWEPAQPANDADVAQLAKLYSPDVRIADDLLKRITEVSRRTTRRICVNIHLVAQEARVLGLDEIDAKTWGDRELYTGEAPARRVF